MHNIPSRYALCAVAAVAVCGRPWIEQEELLYINIPYWKQ